MRKPDFENMLLVLNKQKPNRRTLYEFLVGWHLVEHVNGKLREGATDEEDAQWFADGLAKIGYDCYHVWASKFHFINGEHDSLLTKSLNDNPLITDWDSFERYKWLEPEDFERRMPKVKMPDGMKAFISGPSGVLENTIGIVGYDNLCVMVYDNPELAKTVFDCVGDRLYRYYAAEVADPKVGGLMINDDMGFKTQPMLSPDQLRKYVFPWHKKFVELAHRENKPAILHACGNLLEVYDDIIDDVKMDGKHSYEDVIQPVEEAYELLNPRLAVLGGIDLDFLCRETSENIRKRCNAMFERCENRGGYAVGTGNSMPYYVPVESLLAMASTVFE